MPTRAASARAYGTTSDGSGGAFRPQPVKQDRRAPSGARFFVVSVRRRAHPLRYQRQPRESLRAKLVAAFLTGLSIVPLARAQEASVTLYGRVNVDMEVVNGKQTGRGCPENCPNPNVFRVNSNSSMFGIRGAEPLGEASPRFSRSRTTYSLPRAAASWPAVKRSWVCPGRGYGQDGLFSRAVR